MSQLLRSIRSALERISPVRCNFQGKAGDRLDVISWMGMAGLPQRAISLLPTALTSPLIRNRKSPFGAPAMELLTSLHSRCTNHPMVRSPDQERVALPLFADRGQRAVAGDDQGLFGKRHHAAAQ